MIAMRRPAHGRRHTRRIITVLVTASLLAGAVIAGIAGPSSAAQPTAASMRCRVVRVPVTIAAGPGGQITGDLCLPTRAPTTSVLLMIAGGGENADYWNMPGLGADSLVRSAAREGFATFAIDRLGSGRSSLPVSTRVTYAAQVSTADQVARALRRDASRFGRTWPSVIGIGHSLGSLVLSGVAADHPHDLAAMILTGFGSKVSPQTAVLTQRYQKLARVVDPARWGHLDPGYVATPPDAVGKVGGFYLPDTSAAALAAARRTQGTISVTELTSRPQGAAAVALAGQIRMPVLVADGRYDLHYCLDSTVGAPVRFTASCASRAAFSTYERGVLPHACLATDLVADSGHAIEVQTGAPAANRTFLAWLQATMWTGHPRCTVSGTNRVGSAALFG